MHLRAVQKVLPELIRATTEEGLEPLAVLIKSLTIADHQGEILEAWTVRCEELGWGTDDLGVSAHLIACRSNIGSDSRSVSNSRKRVLSHGGSIH